MTSYGLITDQELFQRIAESNEAAFEELFLRYVPRIEPVIINITGTNAVLKDIVQEVFLQLWLSRHKLVEIEQPDSWIFRMTYNRSYTWVRSQLVRDKHLQQVTQEEKDISDMVQPDEWVSFEETAALVRQAIQTLSPSAQRIFQLREAGMKLQEIAQEAGISTDGVKKSLYRSAQQIREYLVDRGISIPVFLLLWWLEK